MTDKAASTQNAKRLWGKVFGLSPVLQLFKLPFDHSFNLAVTSEEAEAFSLPAV